MTSAIGISHYHLCIVLCESGGSVGCYITMDKPYTTPVNTLCYFILNNWRTRLFTGYAVSPFLGFLGFFAHSLGSLNTWG